MIEKASDSEMKLAESMDNAERYITINTEFDLLNEKLKKITDVAIVTCISHIGDLSVVAVYVHGLLDTADNYIKELIDIAATEENLPDIVLPVPLKNVQEKDIQSYFETVQRELKLRREMFDDAASMGHDKPTTVIDFNMTQALLKHFQQM